MSWFFRIQPGAMARFHNRFLLRLHATAWHSTLEDFMTRSSHTGGRGLYALLALPLLLSLFVFSPLMATQRMVLLEDWENTS